MSIKSVTAKIFSVGKNIKSEVNRFSMPKMKFMEPILRSRIVLYFLLFVTIVTIFTYINANDITSIVTFALVAFLTSFFNKNMIVVLLFALIITATLKFSIRLRYEGFEGKPEEEKGEKKETVDKKEEKENIPPVEDEEKKKDLNKLKKDYKEFEVIQDKILGGVQDINKELDKAEQFINKFESYKNKHAE